MTNYFNSKYPIIALAMNQVSDAKFAIECSNAGIYPSISLFNYYKNNTINYERFIRETTLNNFMLSLTILDLKNKYVLTLIKKLKIPCIEIILPFEQDCLSEEESKLINFLKKDHLICLKCPEYIKNSTIELFDCLILKGKDGAGFIGNNNESIKNIFYKVKNDYPNKKIIVSGGIETKQQIKYFLNEGATAIGIGTLFALSKESSIPFNTKLKMSTNQIKQITNYNNDKKNSIVFSEIDNKEDDLNNSKSLIKGINGIEGHIYAGTAVKNIKEIKSLKQIVEELI